jgi:peptidoglycan LD-endopeptidase CwlK
VDEEAQPEGEVTMKPPIYHSELATALRSLLGRTFDQGSYMDLLSLTQFGVAPIDDVLHVSGYAETDSASVPAAARVAEGVDRESIKVSGFRFGAASLKELEGVKSELVRVTRRALDLSTQDFCVYDGIRTVKEQQQHVKNGTSKTMQSKHLQGLAVDLVPWIGGKPVWDWSGCYKVAMAMDRAATEMGFADKIRWGGAWDRTLADFGGDESAYQRETEFYALRHAGKDFLDGPHFEWVG